MTKALEMLVRLREMELDTIRREVGVLNRQAEAIDQKKAELSQQVVNEQVYLTRLEGMTTYAAYADSVHNWQAELDTDRQGIEEKIDAKMVQVQAAFEALKTAQVALDNAQQKQQRKRAKAEQDMLDETALQQFMQRSESQ
jgi:flagellar biosynthesis chaperone FliJ